MNKKRREKFPARITGIVERAGMEPNIILRDVRYPLDFGPAGRITGIPPNFFIGPHVQGYKHGKQLRAYENFGSGGLAEGVNVWVHCPAGDYGRITYVSPRDEDEA